VALALKRDWFAERGRLLLDWLPLALILTAAIGFHFVATKPFNPLQLQNPATFATQLWLIAAYYVVLRLSERGTIIGRLELLPQAEIGPLVNVAVLGQAIVIALLVLVLPLHGGRRVRTGQGWGATARAVLYFSYLGLGFLFVEMFMIDRASFWLNDRSAGFALVPTFMLIFSSLGAMLTGRYTAIGFGYDRVLLAALLLYLVAWLSFPRLHSGAIRP